MRPGFLLRRAQGGNLKVWRLSPRPLDKAYRMWYPLDSQTTGTRKGTTVSTKVFNADGTVDITLDEEHAPRPGSVYAAGTDVKGKVLPHPRAEGLYIGQTWVDGSLYDETLGSPYREVIESRVVNAMLWAAGWRWNS